jgi:hypothetical protein
MHTDKHGWGQNAESQRTQRVAEIFFTPRFSAFSAPLRFVFVSVSIRVHPWFQKMNSKIFFAALCVCLLAGCRTDEGIIGGSIAAVAPTPRKLDQQELSKVELAIYGYLLQPQFWTNGEYSAVFVQGDGDEFDAVSKLFPNHVPPLKPGGRAQLLPNRTLVDRDTGRPAIILSVVAQDAVGDTIQADGRWFAGAVVSGFHTFTLQQTNDDWRIVSIK